MRTPLAHRDMFGARNEAQQLATGSGHVCWFWQRRDGRWEAGFAPGEYADTAKAAQPRYSRPDEF